MIVKLLLAAILAGLIGGVLVTGAQEARVVPLILHAEEFEKPAAETTTTDADHAHTHGEGSIHDEGSGLLFGLSRFSGTLIANLVTGAGFALVLGGISLVIGAPITVKNGVMWGAAAWLAVHLLPSLGLPPELPGFPAARLEDRQIWWLVAVIFSAVALYLLILRSEVWAKLVGLVLIAAPHIYGAPQPADLTSPVPAVLGAEFAVAALATTLFFWVVLGLALGITGDRLAKMQA